MRSGAPTCRTCSPARMRGLSTSLPTCSALPVAETDSLIEILFAAALRFRDVLAHSWCHRDTERRSMSDSFFGLLFNLIGAQQPGEGQFLLCPQTPQPSCGCLRYLIAATCPRCLGCSSPSIRAGWCAGWRYTGWIQTGTILTG